MIASLNATPQSERLHIGLFGARNVGKSSLINALTGQELAIVSPVAGTTTDPVYKAMELRGVGAVVFIDTAGFDDEGSALGDLRVSKTLAALQKTDLALLLIDGQHIGAATAFRDKLRALDIPAILVQSKSDADSAPAPFADSPVIRVSAATGDGLDALRAAIADAAEALRRDAGDVELLGNLAGPGDVVVLVMPQDPQAPNKRLILPQSQTIRALLDRRCVSVNTTAADLPAALAALRQPPALIITDSQAFRQVYALKPPATRLTSFSILFAHYKGDLAQFVAGANALDSLPPTARVLIAEACTHHPIDGDIGREKIPALLRKRLGDALAVDVVCGADWTDSLAGYDLVVHCGACMFNRRQVLNRLRAAKLAGVPVTNYGVILAKLAGILDQVALP